MGTKSLISELTNLLAIALRHKIGSLVNEKEIYAQKYARDAEMLIEQARKLAIERNWSYSDKQEIRKQLKSKLYKELEDKDFIDNKKFDIMDGEVDSVLRELGLVS